MLQRPDFNKCVAAIVDTLARQVAPSTPSRETTSMVSAFVAATSNRMPDYLRFGFRMLVLMLDSSSYPRKGRPFHQLTLEDRDEVLHRWEFSRLGFRRSLVALCRTLVTFGLFSELYGRD